MQELTDAIQCLTNGKAVRPDGIPVKLFKITLNGDPALRQNLLDIVVGIWRGEVAQHWEELAIKVFTTVDRGRHQKYFAKDIPLSCQ